MKVLLAAPSYPPAGTDGRALHAAALARALVAEGHEVFVLAGGQPGRESGLEPGLEPPGAGANQRRGDRDGKVELLRFVRGDPHPTHWMREGCVELTRTLRGLLNERRPDLLHVVGWERLSNDLVLTAARAGVPAVVELHDQRAACLLRTRVRPEDGSPCTRTYGPYECVTCAAQVAPRPTWVPTDQAYLSWGQRAAAMGRELALAGARLVPDEDHGEALLRALGGELGGLLVPPPADDPAWLPFHLDLYRRVIGVGAPGRSEVGDEEWFEERMRSDAELAWDQAARSCDQDPG